jgi:hypothetical protein
MTVVVRRLLIATTLGAWCLLPRPVAAQSKAECLAAFEHAQELQNQLRLLAAREEYSVCAHTVCSAPVRKDCSERLEQLLRETPSIVLGARLPNGADAIDATVHVDGRPASSEAGGPISVDPGLHTVRFELPHYAPVEQRVMVRAGERNRLVIGVFEGRPPPPPVATSPRADVRASRAQPSPWTWVAGGVGVAALGSFTFFGISGLQTRSDLQGTCAPGCPDSDVSSVKTRFVAADISLGVAAVSLGIAVLLYVTRPTAPHRQVLARSFWK